MTASIWMDLLGHDFDACGAVKYDGESNAPIPGYVRGDIVQETRRRDIVRGENAIYTVGLLNVDAFILFYIMTHILFPRAHNHGRVLKGDWHLLWAIHHRVQVKWRNYMCSYMYKAKHNKPKGALLYAFLVQRILERFEVHMETELMEENKEYNAQFGQRLLERCKILKIGNVWLWHTQPQVEVPMVEPDAQVGEAVADDDDGDDGADLQEMVESNGGWTLSDVMKGINVTLGRISRMELKHKKRWKSMMKKRIRGLGTFRVN